MVAFDKKVSITDDVMVREVEGETVLLNLSNEQYYGLDDVGTRMWVNLTESDSIQVAFDALLAEYDVDEATLRTDVEKLVGDLMEQGLITLG